MNTASPALKKAFQAARTEFKELSIGELKEYETLFVKYTNNETGVLGLLELKYLMEKLGKPQTHLALKAMIAEVDEDRDEQMSYREFLLIFRYAKTGQLRHEGLRALASSVNVDAVGARGAAAFFEAKAKALNDSPAERDRAYYDQRKKEAEEALE
ncbi:EF-hand domain-containing protein [Balamuthia mandrillaris]